MEARSGRGSGRDMQTRTKSNMAIGVYGSWLQLGGRLPMRLGDIHFIDIHSLLEPPLSFLDLDIIPAHLPLTHPTIFRKSPILKTIASLPLHPVTAILVLVPELHGDLVVGESEQLLAQSIGLLLVPLLGQEVDDGFSTGEEAVAVAPDAVGGVGFGDGLRVSVASGLVQRGEMDYDGLLTGHSRDPGLS